MRRIYYLVVAGICLVLSACIQEDIGNGEAGIMPGDTLPSFRVEMNDGTWLATSDLEGKVSVLVFFHTGCPDCRQELPVIQSLYDAYRGQGSVAFYCISREQSADEVEAYWQEHRFSLPYSAQEDRSVYSLFSGQGIPRVYVSTPSLYVYSTYADDPIASLEQLRNDIEACLKESEDEKTLFSALSLCKNKCFH